MANTSKRVLFLPPSDAYVRSFLYLLYTLIKLYYTKALRDQASSLAPDCILLLWKPRIPVSLHRSATTFQCLVTKSCPTFVNPWIVALQALLPIGFSRQEYCSGLPFPSPGDPPDPGIESTSAELAGKIFTTEPPGKPSSTRDRFKSVTVQSACKPSDLH